MANQVTVSNDHSINVTIEPPANVQVQVSRAVIGTIANVPSANTANTVTNNAQPNITSVGTLTSLTSNGNITAPFFIGNVIGNITGNFTVPGNNTAVLFNQTGNAGASDALTFNYSSNVLTANGNIVANYFIGNGSQLTGIVTAQSNNANFANLANFANVANIANSVAGANVTGIVANANYSAYSGIAGVANSVAVANVSGIGNIATVNLDGNASNILYGNGIFSAVPVIANVGNANYANFAGNAFSVNASNIVGTVNLANFATTANAVAGANVSGVVANANYSAYSGIAGVANSVAVANVSGIGNIATVNLDGNVSNLLTGSGTFVAIPTVSANANYANFAGEAFSVSGANVTSQVANANYAIYSGTVITNAQPNITSVGTLTGLVVSGNITPNSNITYDLGNNTNRFKDLYLAGNSIILGAQTISANATGISVTGNLSGDASGLSNIAGANVTGTVANANYSAYSGIAGTANSVAGANVSGAVAFATTANSVAVGNVSGIGNIATVNLDGNVSNLLTGSGTFVAIPTVSSNANYANFAGEAFSVTGSNVSGTVANANYSAYSGIAGSANSVAGANVTGQVANALVSGTVYTNAQPNITSVGTLTSLAVTGNITSFANITGDYFLGNGALLTGVGNFSAALGYHGSFFSNVTQTIASTTTAYPITLNNTSPGTYGVSVTSNSRVTFTYAGTYNIQYSVQFTNTDTAVHNASIWLRKNGVDVPDTNSVFAVTARHGSTDGQLIGAINYIQDVNANDYYELIWQAESTSVSLEYIAPGTTPTSPATPSAIVTAMQVTNVQAATLSGNLTGNLIGNTYGLSGTSFVNIIGNISGNVFTGNGSGLTQLTGANVSGAVAFATTANAVAGANVSGAVAFATTANAVAGANVSGAVAFATTANSVAVANVSGIGNIAVVNLDGSTSNVLYGNGVFAPVAGGGGGSSISNGNSNVNIATSGGDVTVSVNGSSNVLQISNTFLTTNIGYSYTVATPNAQAFQVVQGGTGANGLTANLTNRFLQRWNNASATFEAFTVTATDTASNANSRLFNAITNSTSQFSITKSGNVTFAGVISGNADGLTNIPVGNLSANVNFANTAGTVTTNAQPNITSVGTLTDLTIDGTLGLTVSSSSNTAGRLIVNQASGVGTGLTSNLFNTITQKWNNSSVQFTTLVVGATDVTSNANSLLFNATTNAVSKFSINKSGNVVFAGVMTGDGGGLSNIAGGGTPGGSNTQLQFNNAGSFGGISTVTWNGANISLGAVANVKVTGGSNNEVVRTDGTGNLSFSSIAQTLLVGTRTGPYTVPITNYTFQVTARTGNVTVYVN